MLVSVELVNHIHVRTGAFRCRKLFARFDFRGGERYDSANASVFKNIEARSEIRPDQSG